MNGPLIYLHALLTDRLNDGREGRRALTDERMNALTSLWHDEIDETSRPPLDAYRKQLESRIARHVLAHEEAFRGYDGKAPSVPGVKDVWQLSRWELNGLSIALRMLGGYEGCSFSPDWARGVVASAANSLNDRGDACAKCKKAAEHHSDAAP